MKKVITILAILVVLTSAVFAETHKIKIQATSAEAVPVFEMSIGSIKTNTASAQFGTAENTTLVKTDVAKTINFEEDSTVEVIVKILNAAKTKQNFLLTFGDGVFQVYRNGEASSATGTNLNVTPSIATEEASGTGYSSTGTAGTVTVDFDGTRCDADSVITTATYTYDADATIDPGTYSADIELVITTTN